MNLLDKKTRLILISALFSSGCEDPDTIGLQIKPDKDLLVEFVEIPINGAVMLIDSIGTTNSGRLMFGNYQDPATGRITAEAYSKLRPEIFLDTIADDAELDSVTLSLDLSYYYGVDFDVLQNLSVHELQDTIPKLRNITSTKLSFKPEPLLNANFAVPFNKDTTLTIKSPPGALTELFEILKEFDYTDQDGFNQLFKGIAITSGQLNSAIYGANPNTLRSFLRLHYSSPGDDDPSEFDLFFNAVTHYSYIKANFEGTALQDLTNFYQPLIPGSDSLYLQGGTGLTFILDFGPFLEFTDTISNLTITQTDLEIGPILAPPQGLPAPQVMTILPVSDDNRINVSDTLLVNDLLENSPLIVAFNEKNLLYDGRITRYTQLLAEGEIEMNRLIVLPAGSNTTVNRASTLRENVVLKVFYTRFAQ